MTVPITPDPPEGLNTIERLYWITAVEIQAGDETAHVTGAEISRRLDHNEETVRNRIRRMKSRGQWTFPQPRAGGVRRRPREGTSREPKVSGRRGSVRLSGRRFLSED